MKDTAAARDLLAHAAALGALVSTDDMRAYLAGRTAGGYDVATAPAYIVRAAILGIMRAVIAELARTCSLEALAETGRALQAAGPANPYEAAAERFCAAESARSAAREEASRIMAAADEAYDAASEDLRQYESRPGIPLPQYDTARTVPAAPGFAVGDEVASATGVFDGTGRVTGVREDQGVTTVSVEMPRDAGIVTAAGTAGFAPEDLRRP